MEIGPVGGIVREVQRRRCGDTRSNRNVGYYQMHLFLFHGGGNADAQRREHRRKVIVGAERHRFLERQRMRPRFSSVTEFLSSIPAKERRRHLTDLWRATIEGKMGGMTDALRVKHPLGMTFSLFSKLRDIHAFTGCYRARFDWVITYPEVKGNIIEDIEAAGQAEIAFVDVDQVDYQFLHEGDLYFESFNCPVVRRKVWGFHYPNDHKPSEVTAKQRRTHCESRSTLKSSRVRPTKSHSGELSGELPDSEGGTIV